MRTPSFTGQFKKDRRLARKHGWDVDVLDGVLAQLIAEEPLPARYKAHPLRGDFAGHWECHLGPDFLLIWYYSGASDIVFVRTGTHADLFG